MFRRGDGRDESLATFLPVLVISTTHLPTPGFCLCSVGAVFKMFRVPAGCLGVLLVIPGGTQSGTFLAVPVPPSPPPTPKLTVDRTLLHVDAYPP